MGSSAPDTHTASDELWSRLSHAEQQEIMQAMERSLRSSAPDAHPRSELRE